VSAADALIQSNLLGEAVENAALAVFVCDDDNRYVAVNRRACELLGYTREELLALRMNDVFAAPEEALAHYQEVQAHLRHSGEHVLLRKDGGLVPMRYCAGETTIAGLSFYVGVGWLA
jgi:PAS domain S-box-containing protein